MSSKNRTVTVDLVTLVNLLASFMQTYESELTGKLSFTEEDMQRIDYLAATGLAYIMEQHPEKFRLSESTTSSAVTAKEGSH